MRHYRIILFFICMIASGKATGQIVAVKTNLLYDATATINIGMEAGISRKWTIDVSGNFNGWDMPHDRKWKHWLVQPEARYWLCDYFSGHFVGIHAIGGQYNAGHISNGIKLFGTDWSKLSDYRYEGWFAGAGITYGYAWPLGDHWNIEGELGLGWIYTKYDRYRCAGCGKKEAEDQTNSFIAPTKAALNIVYIF